MQLYELFGAFYSVGPHDLLLRGRSHCPTDLHCDSFLRLSQGGTLALHRARETGSSCRLRYFPHCSCLFTLPLSRTNPLTYWCPVLSVPEPWTPLSCNSGFVFCFASDVCHTCKRSLALTSLRDLYLYLTLNGDY